MRPHHPWSSSVENEVDIMPVSRDQYNTRKTTIDKHFLRRRLVDKRKEEWKKMLSTKEENVPTSIHCRANAKNSVKREVVAATAQRLNDDSHAAIREMRAARLSARVTAAPTIETKSQSAREMRLARLKQSTSIDSSPLVQPKSLKKAVRVERAPEQPKPREQVSTLIRERRVAQGKNPVAKSYTSTTPVLRVPKTSTPPPAAAVRSVRPQSTVPIRKTPKPPVEVVEQDDTNDGCDFVNTSDLTGGCNHFVTSNKDDSCPNVPLEGGCNAAADSENVGCDLSLFKDYFASFFDCGKESTPGAELVSGGSSEDSATMYIKKYGYEY